MLETNSQLIQALHFKKKLFDPNITQECKSHIPIQSPKITFKMRKTSNMVLKKIEVSQSQF